MYQTINAYRQDPEIFFNEKNREAYPSAIINSDRVVDIGGDRRIMAGSFITGSGRVLPRSKVLTPYASGGTTIVVGNPWAFQVGDVIHAIGGANESAAADLASFTTPVQVGTVTAINKSIVKAKTRVTVASPAIGDVYSIFFDNRAKEVRFTATTNVLADAIQGLYNAILNISSDFSTLNYLTIDVGAGFLEFTHQENNCPFTIDASKTGTGTITVSSVAAVGVLTIAPAGGNPALGIGRKIGTLVDRPVGVVEREFLLTDIRQNDIADTVVIYNAANLVKSALPYIDGNILQTLPKVAVFPALAA